METLRVVCYLNQFFGQLGGEDKAGVGPQVVAGAVGAARAVQQALGVKTALIVEDMSTDGSAQGMLLFNFPGMDALVNIGCGQEPLLLPAMERIIGADDLVARLQGEMRATYGTLCGAIEQVGSTRVVAQVR